MEIVRTASLGRSFLAASMGFVGYGIQWLVIRNLISLPYFVVFLLCLVAGCSICWFNTACFVLCIRNFQLNRSLALSLTISFNGVSAAFYTLAANSISSGSSSLYLLLNALLPLLASLAALIPMIRQPPINSLSPDAARRDSLVFLVLNFLALLTGLYLLLLNSISSIASTARLLFAGAIILLLLPLFIPGTVLARNWARHTIYSQFNFQGSAFNLLEVDDLELHKQLISGDTNGDAAGPGGSEDVYRVTQNCCQKVMEKDKLGLLGEEHSARMLVCRLDFWLYYVTYLCGATLGLVYSNNLGQIAQSLSHSSQTTTLVTLYSSFSFFGLLLSAAPDFLRGKVYYARTGWLAIALTPMPVAFFLLAISPSNHVLNAGTALIGLGSGFIFAAAVSVTSELFGPNSVGVNHNILITNIPIGSLFYGLLAALIYDASGSSSSSSNLIEQFLSDTVVCMGTQCYRETFVWWGVISLLGLASGVVLFLRTRPAYDRWIHL